mgnify:CR=1 FL=1
MQTEEARSPGALDLRTLCIAAIAQLVGSASDRSQEAAYLADQLPRGLTGRTAWRAALDDYLRAPAPADEPLLALHPQLGLSLAEQLAVTLAAAVEEDVSLGRALAYLQAPLGGSRPTLGLLATALADLERPGRGVLQSLLTGPGVRSGLLTVLGDTAPLPERVLALPLPLYLALRGEDAPFPGATIGLGEFPAVTLPPSLQAAAERHARSLTASSPHALVLRTGSPTEGRSVACAMAATLGRRAVFLGAAAPSGLGPWLLLRGLIPVFCLELEPGQRHHIPAIPYYDGPRLVLCGPEGSVETPAGSAPSFVLPVPPPGERLALWQNELGHGELAVELARAHRHGSGRIAHLGRLARQRAALADRNAPTRADVSEAAWIGEGAGLDALAQPLRAPITDSALVVSKSVRADLDLLLLRCRTRDGLVDGLGQSAVARYSPGVRALFVGPSGTGKTLAAGWLATRLGIPLFRVDLAAVTSKYIGETEKHLAQLLARAEQSEVVLLFDEADSLFSKRTDVKDANDRFANSQTNYLLQRIEQFDGITLLTSNSRSRFDAAFTRRLDVIIEFQLPGPEERRAIWQSHLGPHHRLQPRQINQIAATVDLPGGHIRNVVLTAAVLAQAEQRPIEFADLMIGLTAEYRKLGRQPPGGLEQERN